MTSQSASTHQWREVLNMKRTIQRESADPCLAQLALAGIGLCVQFSASGHGSMNFPCESLRFNLWHISTYPSNLVSLSNPAHGRRHMNTIRNNRVDSGNVIALAWHGILTQPNTSDGHTAVSYSDARSAHALLQVL